MFHGAITALITPFSEGQVDYQTLEELVEFQIESGIDGIVPVGTTGESPTLSYEEHKEVIRRVVDITDGRASIIAGTGSNSTAEAIELTEYAKKVGADASLQVCPYYNKPTQEGFYQHFKTITEEVDLPLVLYNIPGRCGGTGLTIETVERLAKLENIVAIKEATGSLDFCAEIAQRTELTLLSGDDSLTLAIASIGGKGVISVISNIVPADVKAMTDLILEGDFVSARKWHRKLFPLTKNMMNLSTNPIPIKAAAAILGMASEELRLPMVPLDDSQKAKLQTMLKEYGLLDE